MELTPNSGNWQLALDLLIARAALDSTLAQELSDNTIPCCKANGVEIPAGINVVIKKPSQEVLIKTIPELQGSSFESTVSLTKLVNSHSFNQAEEEASEEVNVETYSVIGPTVVEVEEMTVVVEVNAT